ncbi:MAG: type IX secretion system sortase PorU, partial [Candidatus Kapabacteria bacterium]|nr:type IX secretion system sortase PorU [Candidatus Kapabacteria bacterium]
MFLKTFQLFSLFILSSIVLLCFNSDIKVLKSDERELILSYKPQFSGFTEVKLANGIKSYLPKIKDAILSESKSGNYQKLVVKDLISIPSKKGFKVERVDAIDVIEYDNLMAPVPTFEKNKDNISIPKYMISENFKSNFSNDFAEVNYGGFARFQEVADVVFDVAQYNPKTKKIVIPTEIRITISFDFRENTNPYFTNDETNVFVKNNPNIVKTLNFDIAENWRANSLSNLKFATDMVNYAKSIASKNKSNSIQANDKYDWFKIEVSHEGVYSIDASQLSSLGINIPNDKVNTIKIYGNGGDNLSENVLDGMLNKMNEQSIIVNKNASGGIDNIIFYGSPANGFQTISNDAIGFKHYLNYFSKSNYYLLTWDGSVGRRANAIESPNGNPINRPTTYIHKIFSEEELLNPYPSGSGRQYLGKSYFAAPEQNTLYNLDKNGEIKYRISLVQKASTEGSMKVSENGNVFDKILYLGTTNSSQFGAKSEFVLSAKANLISSDRSILKFDFQNPSSQTAICYLDYYEIHYPRSFYAIESSINFFTNPNLVGLTEFNIAGFNNKSKYAFDVTELSNPILLKNNANDGDKFIFKVDLSKDTIRRYFISTELQKANISKTEFGYLRDNLPSDADAILITHPDFINSATKFKEYRDSSSNLKVSIVRTDYIYNEFASGIPDVTSIKDYVTFAMLNSKVKAPKYLILWGDGHFDYRNLQSTAKNFVPPYEAIDDASVFDETYSTCTDDFFSRVVGNDEKADIGVGRITINSDEEGIRILEKIKNYENNSDKGNWRTKITIVADDGPTSNGENQGSMHTNQAEELSANYITKDLMQRKIYLPDYPTEFISSGRRKPSCNADLITSVNQGNLFLCWVGHGNPKVWAHEQIFERDKSVSEMINYNKLFFLNAATCDFGKFDMIDERSGAEELFMSKYGGAIGALATTRVVFSGANSVINNNFYQRLLTRDPITNEYPRLGDAFMNLKTTFTTDNDEKFYLLGDPTMQLLLPNYTVSFDSINGIDPKSTIDLKGLENVTISGSILNLDGKSILNDFNGDITLAMFDGDVQVKVYDEDSREYDYSKLGGALSKGTFKVENGIFKATFILPKDISFSDNKGRLFAFASSYDKKFAKGYNGNFKITGINTSVPSTDKPEIKIFFDSRNFKECDNVRKTPLLIVDLYDKYGINSTGLGIGHRIEAWIDDNPNSIDLTDRYNTSISDNHFGSAEVLISGLKKGKHTIRVRAWNIYNNYAEAEACFIVAPESEGIIITDLINYPNPFDLNTTFRFSHNVEPPFKANVYVYNSVGSKVREINI